jgi:hypothetical protein
LKNKKGHGEVIQMKPSMLPPHTGRRAKVRGKKTSKASGPQKNQQVSTASRGAARSKAFESGRDLFIIGASGHLSAS